MYLDTRDLDKRLDELESLEYAYKDAQEEFKEAQKDYDEDHNDQTDERLADAIISLKEAEEAFTEEEEAELKELRDLRDEISEWRHGETLIPEDEWVEYVEELAKEIGAIGENADWIVVDWEETAENLAQDYAIVTYQGQDYYVRNC